MIQVMHSFVENGVISESKLTMNSHDAESEAEIQPDNGRLVIVWGKAARG